MATQGDPDAPVNRGLNCIKGYFLSKIMYGSDRLTQPLLRMSDGEYDKEGEFTPVSWDEAFAHAASELRRIQAKYGRSSIGGVSSSRCTNEEIFLTTKLVRARQRCTAR